VSSMIPSKSKAPRSRAGMKPSRFVQVDKRRGLDRIQSLLSIPGGRLVGQLWVLLMREADHHNAIVASRHVLAQALQCSVRSITDATAKLQEQGAIDIFRTGSSSVFILNPDEVWQSAKHHRAFCSFGAKVLLGFDENPGVRVRMTELLETDPDETGGAVSKRKPGRPRKVPEPAAAPDHYDDRGEPLPF
jgi:hypothetical protein